MNPLKLLALAMALCAAIPAPAAAQNISGDWEVTVESPQGQAAIDATFKQEGEAVTGTVTSPMGTVDFKGTLANNVLNVAYKLEVQGNAMDITMNGAVDGDTMKGLLTIVGMGEIPWTAKRKVAGGATTANATPAAAGGAAPAAASGNITGKWDLTLNTGQGEFPMTAAFTQSGDNVTGTFSSPMGEMPVAGTMIGSALKLEFVAPTPQGDIAVIWTGELGPNGFFKGKATMTGLGEAEWVGKRAEQQ